MASVFENVTLIWGGKTFVIPADKVMGAIMKIERILTMKELSEAMQNQGAVPFGALSSAYGAVLRYAGASVLDDEVYQGMFIGGDNQRANMMAAVTGLLDMMIPPSVRNSLREEAVGGKGKQRPAAARSSKPRTKQRSAN